MNTHYNWISCEYSFWLYNANSRSLGQTGTNGISSLHEGRWYIFYICVCVCPWSWTHAYLYITETLKGVVAVILNILPPPSTTWQISGANTLRIFENQIWCSPQSVDCVFALRVSHSGWLRVPLSSSVLGYFFLVLSWNDFKVCLPRFLPFMWVSLVQPRALCMLTSDPSECRIWLRGEKSGRKEANIVFIFLQVGRPKTALCGTFRSPRAHRLHLHLLLFFQIGFIDFVVLTMLGWRSVLRMALTFQVEINLNPVMVAHICNSNTLQAETEGLLWILA